MASTKSSGSCSFSREALVDLVRFVVAQQPVVDEDAGQPVADGAVNQHRRDRRIDAARQAAHDLAVADLRAGCASVASSMNEAIVQSPRAAADAVGEVAAGSRRRDRCARPRDGTAARRAPRSGASIAAIGAVALVAATAKPGRHRRRRRRRGSPRRAARWNVGEQPRRDGDAAPPDLPRPPARRRDATMRVAELAMTRAAHLAAEHVGHQLHAVADAEHRRAELEEPGVALRRAGVRHAARSAGQDDPAGCFARSVSSGVLNGTTSEYTDSSRRRRAMSCVYCEPKSRTRMV